MNFFDQFARPGRPEPGAERLPRWTKPEAILGSAVGRETLLGRGDDAAVGLGGLIAYPHGFGFTITAVLRQEDRRGRVFRLGFHRDLSDEEPLPAEFLRVGVQFADGGAASNTSGYHPPDPHEEPAGPLLLPDHGGGGGRRYEMSYWVWPLPPPGPVTFVCSWPAHHIVEARAEVDAALIHEAAARAITLWPDD